MDRRWHCIVCSKSADEDNSKSEWFKSRESFIYLYFKSHQFKIPLIEISTFQKPSSQNLYSSKSLWLKSLQFKIPIVKIPFIEISMVPNSYSRKLCVSKSLWSTCLQFKIPIVVIFTVPTVDIAAVQNTFNSNLYSSKPHSRNLEKILNGRLSY